MVQIELSDNYGGIRHDVHLHTDCNAAAHAYVQKLTGPRAQAQHPMVCALRDRCLSGYVCHAHVSDTAKQTPGGASLV